MNAPYKFGARATKPQASERLGSERLAGKRYTRPIRQSEAIIKVMIVDDSLTVRTIFKRMVESAPCLQVSDTASSGERAIALIAKSPADVVLLDLEMPGMGGLEALPQILAAAPQAQVLVVSSLTSDGAEMTLEALSQGAADTLLKPRPGEFTQKYRSQLLKKIKALGTKEKSASGIAQRQRQTPQGPASDAPISKSLPTHSAWPASSALSKTKPVEAIAIGASTGGIHALNIMLRTLGPACTVPILITQHLPASFIPVFARQVENVSGRRTQIAEDGTEIRRGEIALATGHSHMCIKRQAGRLIARSTSEPASSGCLPSVDPMLASLAEACEGNALGILLSGMGRDGLEGAGKLVEAGGAIWAQDAQTSAVWGMPGAVAKAGLTSLVASPEALGMAIMDKLADKRSFAS